MVAEEEPKKGSKINRRTALVALSGAIGLGVAKASGLLDTSFVNLAHASTPQEETPSSLVTKESIEARGVRLITYRDVPKWIKINCASQKGTQGVLRDSCEDLPRDWTQEHLDVLNKILDVIPPHMIQGMEVVLSNTYDAGSVTNPIERNKMQVDIRDFNQSNMKRALTGMVHESSHLLTPMENQTLPSDGRITYGLKVGSPWFDELYGILGGGFNVFPDGFAAKMDDLKKQVKDVPRPDASTGEIDIIQRRLAYGIGYYPTELIGVVGEQLLFGKGVFMERFTSDDFFTLEQAQQLHDFGVSHIYRGVTFDKFPLD